MLNRQEWFDRLYPREKRNYTKVLNICLKNLAGHLDLSDFINLKELNCFDNNLTSLNLSNCPQLKELHCSWNNLTTLDLNNCPQLEKITCVSNNLTELDISDNCKLKELDCSENKSLIFLHVNDNSKLTKLNCSYCNLTSLIVNDNPRLETLICSNNQLTLLTFSALPELTTLNCSNNSLTNLRFLNNYLIPSRLVEISISDNNFTPSELTVFSKFINLRWLYIGSGNEKKINQGIYNRFTGSLAPLAKLTKLTELDIANTDINDGLEYLSDSLIRFDCSSEARPTALVQKLIQELTVYGEPDGINYAHLLKFRKQEKKYPFLKQLRQLKSQSAEKAQEINHLRELLKNKEHLIPLLEYSLISKDDFDNSYQLIINIDNNEELIKTKEREVPKLKDSIETNQKRITNFQEEIKQLDAFDPFDPFYRKEKEEREEQINHSQEQINSNSEKIPKLQNDIIKLTTQNQEIIKLKKCLDNLIKAFNELKKEIEKEEGHLIFLRKKIFINYCWLESEELPSNNIRLSLLEEITNLETLIQPLVNTEIIRQVLRTFIFETEETIKVLEKQNQEYYQPKVEVPPKS